MLIVEPIEEINNAASRLAKGDVGKRVRIIGNNEIGELAQSFNRMAQSIEESDTIRKEFISNVSHELKTPLTAISGYAELISNGMTQV